MWPQQQGDELAMRSWVDFWNAEHTIYVNARHKQLHAGRVSLDIERHIPGPHAVVLDYGCGEALYAVHIAGLCRQLILCDAAPRICEQLARRLAGTTNVRVLEPVGVEQLPDGSLDLIIANSLLQYLTRADLEALLDLWFAKLKPGGALVIADVIPPHVNPLLSMSPLYAPDSKPAPSKTAITLVSAGAGRRKLRGFGHQPHCARRTRQ